MEFGSARQQIDFLWRSDEKWQRDVSRFKMKNVTHDDVSRVVRNGYSYSILFIPISIVGNDIFGYCLARGNKY